jgi:hypothetical protein
MREVSGTDISSGNLYISVFLDGSHSIMNENVYEW